MPDAKSDALASARDRPSECIVSTKSLNAPLWPRPPRFAIGMTSAGSAKCCAGGESARSCSGGGGGGDADGSMSASARGSGMAGGGNGGDGDDADGDARARRAEG